MGDWNDLSFRDKTAYIKTAVKNGITNKEDIINHYNKFNSDYHAKNLVDDMIYGNGAQEVKVGTNPYNYNTYDEYWERMQEEIARDNERKNRVATVNLPGDRMINGRWVKDSDVKSIPERIKAQAKSNRETVANMANANYSAVQRIKNHSFKDAVKAAANSYVNYLKTTPSTPLHTPYAKFQLEQRAASSDPVEYAKTPFYMVPFLGTAMAGYDYYKDPSPANGVGLGLSLIGDGIFARPVARALSATGKNISKASKATKSRYLFTQQPNSFTRGIGGEEGLRDAVQSNLIRGNPVGTEVNAKMFTKMTKGNRYHFRDIINDTKIKGIEHRFYNRTLTEKDFNAIKKASQNPKYSSTDMVLKNGILTEEVTSDDPLLVYKSYDDYVKKINADRASLEHATSIGPDGQPLAYFYDDGRNPLTKGHGYAKSKYGVQVQNASEYNPKIFKGHLHYSFPNAPSITDPNVSFYKNGPFNSTLRMNPQTGNSILYEDLSRSWKSFTDWQRAHPIFNRTIKAPIQKDQANNYENLAEFVKNRLQQRGYKW